MSQWKWEESAGIPQEVCWRVSLSKVKTSEEVRPAKHCRISKAQRRPGGCCMALSHKSLVHCLQGSLFTPPKHHVSSEASALEKTSHALSCVCFIKTCFHKMASSKTLHGTTEFPKKPEISTLSLTFHLLWPLGFQESSTGECHWQSLFEQSGHIGLTSVSEKQLQGPGLSAKFPKFIFACWSCLSETDLSGAGFPQSASS